MQVGLTATKRRPSCPWPRPRLQCKRAATQQLHDSKISFPLTRKMARPTSRKYKTTFKAVRPNVALY